MSNLPTRLMLCHRHKWFASSVRDAADGWYGPYATMEQAALKCANEEGAHVVYVTQGYRMTKAEREEKGVEYTWEVGANAAVEVRVP